jgi:hypothetical protein
MPKKTSFAPLPASLLAAPDTLRNRPTTLQEQLLQLQIASHRRLLRVLASKEAMPATLRIFYRTRQRASAYLQKELRQMQRDLRRLQPSSPRKAVAD